MFWEPWNYFFQSMYKLERHNLISHLNEQTQLPDNLLWILHCMTQRAETPSEATDISASHWVFFFLFPKNILSQHIEVACILVLLTQWWLFASHNSHLWWCVNGIAKWKFPEITETQMAPYSKVCKNWVIYFASEETICVRKLDINRTVNN